MEFAMHKLEQIESFGAFLDFLSNPDEYKGLIKDVRAAAKEYKEIVEKKRKIKDIDKWRADEGVRIQGLYDAIDAREDALAQGVNTLASDKAEHKKAIAQANVRMRDREAAVAAREEAVTKLEAEREKVLKLEAEYETKLNQLRAERDRMKAKAAEIAAAAGGFK